MPEQRSTERLSPFEDGKNIRILIADDSRVLRRIIKLILASQADIEVVGEASDGLECLKLATTLKPDLITLDINMPVKDGIETLKTLREFSDTPVIIISALPVEDDAMAIQLKELGASATVMKNFSEGPIGLASFEADLLGAVRAIQNEVCGVNDSGL
ncbi:response regulator [bacterium]|nr:response regulator [bacterium]